MSEPYFVYVGSERHVWRFVHFAPQAVSGDDAIRQAWADAIELGQVPEGDYMAAPAAVITTRSTDPTAHDHAHGGADAR